MSLLAVLPVAAFLLIFASFLKRNLYAVRFSFLWAAMLWALVAVIMSEGLSLFRALTPWAVAGGWTAAVLISLGFFVIPAKDPKKASADRLKDLSKTEMILCGLTAVVIIIIGVNAYLAAPNNWDSMTYHLPRIFHWIQNQTVDYYPTHILRQLYQPPGAEFLILQFQILTNSDQWSNMVQWFAMLGSALVLSLIAGELGCGRPTQILTAFLAVTIPMGILQGSSTQNDYVAGFWLVSFVLFGLRLIRNELTLRQSWRDIVGAGLALGLAFLTKGTVYIFAAPWVLAFVVAGFLKKRKNIFAELSIVILIALMINAGFYSRNMKLFGTPLSAGTENYMNSGGLVGNGISNAIRNTALHFGTPSTEFNAALKENILHLHSFLGLGKIDEANTWGEFDIPAWSTSEDVAGNPLHLTLIIVALILVFAVKQPALVRFYSFALFASFILFCTLLKWQLFHSRLELPLFLLSIPVVAGIFQGVRPKWFILFLTAILLLSALPPLFCNERHPLIGKKNVFNMKRVEQYFYYRKFMSLPYLVAVKYASSRPVPEIGLLVGGDDWEYPLWVLLKKEKPDVRIRHVGVTNISKSLNSENGNNMPLIISEMADPPDSLMIDGETYLKRQQFSFVSIYEH